MNEAHRQRDAGRRFVALVAGLAWATLVVNFVDGVVQRDGDVLATLWRHYWFFTVWTNTLCAIVLTAIAADRWAGRSSFWSRPSTATGASAAIIIVGVVYNLMLRSFYSPGGLDGVINEMMHVVLPVLFVADWVFFVDKRELSWRGLAWVAYPLIYMVYALVRGLLTDLYPYPFADVGLLGFPRAILNSAVILAVYTLVVILLNAFGRKRSSR